MRKPSLWGFAVLLAFSPSLPVAAHAQSSTAANRTYSVEEDYRNYMDIWWAGPVCPGIEINSEQTKAQIIIIGFAMGISEVETATELSLNSARLITEYQEDAYAFCSNYRALFRSYDRIHLIRTGVIPER